MRLIDADDFIKKFSYAKANTVEENVMCATIRRMIKEQPIAFDVDKVVEQLETRKTKATTLQKENISEHFEGENDAFEFAIKIVKGGGVE